MEGYGLQLWAANAESNRLKGQLTVKGDNIFKYGDRFKGGNLTKHQVSSTVKSSLGNVSMSPSALLQMIDTADRPAGTSVVGTYAMTDTYACEPENAPMKRIPKAGAYAGAGVGRARAEYSVFDAEAKGPNALAGAEANVFGAEAMARAELGSVSARAGPIKATLGLGVDTGVRVGVDGVEAKFLGTGFTLGPKTSISFLGSEVSCVIS